MQLYFAMVMTAKFESNILPFTMACARPSIDIFNWVGSRISRMVTTATIMYVRGGGVVAIG